MKNINVDFTPTQADLNEIEKWLIEEDSKSNEGFYCNWETIVYRFEKNQMAIIREYDKPIGFLTYYFNHLSANIEIAEIQPKYRKKGIGTILVNAVLFFFKSEKCKYVELKCSPASSQAYWESKGFKECPVMQHILMYKSLVETSKNTLQLSDNRIELYDVRKYEMNKYPPIKVWNLEFEGSSYKLKKPIIHPCLSYWVLRWIKDGIEVESDDIKWFLNRSIEYGTCFIIEELKE